MYLTTKNETNKMLFNQTWKQIAEEIECAYSPVSDGGHLILDESGQGIGTIELIPFQPHSKQAVDTYFDFSNCQDILKYGDKLHAIGKLGLLKESRGSKGGHFQTLLEAIIEHSQENGVDYYIATLNKDVYRSLMFLYRPKLEILSDRIELSKISIYPVVLHMKETLERCKKQKWYQERYNLIHA
jgi:hypothetical protein